MYDLISSLINHNWDNSMYGNEQQYIYYICGFLIVMLTTVIIDLVYRLVKSLIKKGE